MVSSHVFRVLLILSFAASAQTAAVAGKIAGVWSWRTFKTPNGLEPIQNWYCVATDSAGNAFVGGMDHKTNSALYRMGADEQVLRYAGDAAEASRAAQNWLSGETVEKFHTKPEVFENRAYVATMDYSAEDAGYLNQRGFHWYAYDFYSKKFIDLSAKDSSATPGDKRAGISGKGSIVSIAVDPRARILYGVNNPTGELYGYDIARGRTFNCGRPSGYTDAYIKASRFIWVGGDGKVYFAHKPSSGSVYIHSWNPQTKTFTKHDWLMDANHEPSLGQWNRDRTKCYLANREGYIYCFDDQAKTFTRLGRIRHSGGETFAMRVFQLTPDETTIYAINDWYNDKTPGRYLWAFDIKSGSVTRLAQINQLSDMAGHASVQWCAGSGTWDMPGRFYVASFDWSAASGYVALTRIDPVRVLVHLDKLPSLVEVGVTKGAGTVVFSRKGPTTASLVVYYQVHRNGKASDAEFGKVTIAAGASSATLMESALSSGMLYLQSDGTSYAVVETAASLAVAGPGSPVGSAPSRFHPAVSNTGAGHAFTVLGRRIDGGVQHARWLSLIPPDKSTLVLHADKSMHSSFEEAHHE